LAKDWRRFEGWHFINAYHYLRFLFPQPSRRLRNLHFVGACMIAVNLGEGPAGGDKGVGINWRMHIAT
jgi:hypothetical protein